MSEVRPPTNAVFERDNFRCLFCEARWPDVELVVDWALPKSDPKASGKMWNCVTACVACRDAKAAVGGRIYTFAKFQALRTWLAIKAEAGMPTDTFERLLLDQRAKEEGVSAGFAPPRQVAPRKPRPKPRRRYIDKFLFQDESRRRK